MIPEPRGQVSVIIPVFNGERYLAEAIESALTQAYAPLEVIVVDDGSTDGSAAVARRYSSGVLLAAQPHAGPAAARNRGAELARGDLLAFLDADDRWPEYKLDRQIEALRREPHLDAVFGQVRQLRDGQEWADAIAGRSHDGANLIAGYAAGAMLVRRDAFWRVGAFSAAWRVGEFIDWFARATEAGLAMQFVPEVVLWRRLHESNLGLQDRAAAVDYTRVVREALRRRRASPPRDEAT